MKSIRAKKNKAGFILIVIIMTAFDSLVIWPLFRDSNISLGGAFLVFMLSSFSGGFMWVHLKKLQSVELTEEGVRSLAWKWQIGIKKFPRIERTILRWNDIKKWLIVDYTIYLYGSKKKVEINMLFFDDGNAVIRYINSATGATKQSKT